MATTRRSVKLTFPLTPVTLVSGESWVALAAEGAPVGEAGGLNAAGGAGRRHTHPVCQPAPGAAVHALAWRRQVVHLRDGEGGTV